VSGEVRVGGQACGHVAVDLYLRDAKTGELTRAGTLATGDDGTFTGSVVVPASLKLGPYDLVAKAVAGGECGGR
jgi:hypothetical protein